MSETNDRMTNRRTQVIYSRLASILDQQFTDLARNPWPALKAMGDRCVALQKKLDRIDEALNPAQKVINDGSMMALDIRAEIMARQNAALRILEES